MKYIKLFDKDTDYQSLITGAGVVLPNVSHTVDANKVYYNPYDPSAEPTTVIEYTTTDESLIGAGYAHDTGSGNATSEQVYFYDVKGNKLLVKSNTYANGKGIITLIGIPTSFDSHYFVGYHKLKSVTFPETITKIGDYCFSYDYNLISLTFKSTIPPTTNNNSEALNTGFLDLSEADNFTKIYVPSSSISAYESSKGWSYYAQYSRFAAI